LFHRNDEGTKMTRKHSNKSNRTGSAEKTVNNQNLYYRWSKDFLEAGKKRLSGDTEREANTTEVKGLRTESRQLKEALAEQVLENRLLKKSVIGDGEDDT